MIKTGHWIGQYEYDNYFIQRMTGSRATNFEIEILTVDKNTFSGSVQDDITTGGTEGIGKINGKIDGENVEFIKQMPILSLLIDKTGTRKTFQKKHTKIYYSGTFSKDKNSISGQWRIKSRLIWNGIIPIRVMPTKGTWTMKLKV